MSTLGLCLVSTRSSISNARISLEQLLCEAPLFWVTRGPAKQPPPSEEDIRSFVFDSLFDNRWDNDLRVRRISLTADAPSFKVKVPRTSRAGVNETLTGEQVAARLVSVMRSRAHRGKTMDEWRKEQLAWLLDPVRPAKKG